MLSNPTTSWLLLRLQYTAGHLSITAEDSRGDSRPEPGPPPQASSYSLRVVAQLCYEGKPLSVDKDADAPLWLPTDLPQRIQAMLPEFPASPPVEPFPVFLEGTEIDRDLDWERLLGNLLSDLLARSKVQGPLGGLSIIRLGAKRPWEQREPLRLPLRVGLVGPGAAGYAAAVQARNWYDGDEFVRNYGMQFEALSGEAGQLTAWAGGFSLVLCDLATAWDLLEPRRWAGVTTPNLPRLIGVVDPPSEGREWRRAWPGSPPSGVSLLWLPLKSPETAPEAIQELLYGIIHDLPLHRVLLRQLSGLFREQPRLVSDPNRLDDLRLGVAVDALFDELAEFESQEFPGQVSDFLQRLGEEATQQARIRLPEIAEMASPLDRLVQAARNLQGENLTFAQEARGLVPLARALGSKAEATSRRESVRNALKDMLLDQATREVFARYQDRRVDVALGRLDSSWLSNPYVRPNDSLRRGARYRLRVQIGRRLFISLVQGDVPPVDPFLPTPKDERGHLLHVVIYPLDFSPGRPLVRRLVLPPLGPSEPINFEVGAPDVTGTARLRIAVYYDLPPDAGPEGEEAYYNHLIQSFLLEALIEDYERNVPGAAVTTVRLEFSRSARLANLNELRPRLLSIGLNANGDQTHALMIKGGSRVGQFHLTEQVLWQQLQAVRGLFRRATVDSQGLPLFRDGDTSPQRENLFDDTVRDLAARGKELYNLLWLAAPPAVQEEVFPEVRQATDKVLQIVRYDQAYFFPWAVLYDFPLPDILAGDAPVAVCRGFQRRGPDGTVLSCAQCLANCQYPNKKETYCVYGFWGLRHQVEQALSPPGKLVDSIRTVRPRRRDGVCVSVGVEGRIAGGLLGHLQTLIPREYFRPLRSLNELLTLLWADDRRPWLLVLLGHYEQHDQVGQPTGPRLSLPGGQWLRTSDLVGRAQEMPHKWTDPHPLVLLAACESVADDLGTLTSYLSAFGDIRVAAVVGTEAVIFQGLATRFAAAISQAVLNNQSLGQAVLAFRRALIIERNPLGFVFTPFGDANLTVEAASSPVATAAVVAGGS